MTSGRGRVALFAKDFRLTWSRAGLLQDHPVVCSVGCLSSCRKWLYTQTNSCWLRPVKPGTATYSPPHSRIAKYSPVQTTTAHHHQCSESIPPCIYISSLSRQSFAPKHPGLVCLCSVCRSEEQEQTFECDARANLCKLRQQSLVNNSGINCINITMSGLADCCVGN